MDENDDADPMAAEKKEVMELLDNYSKAFMTFEPKSVIDYFNQPMLYLSDDGANVFKNKEEITTFLKNYMTNLKDKEYAQDELSNFNIITLTTTVAVTAFNLVRVNKAGEAFDRMGAMYMWRKSDGRWRLIIGVLLSQ